VILGVDGWAEAHTKALAPFQTWQFSTPQLVGAFRIVQRVAARLEPRHLASAGCRARLGEECLSLFADASVSCRFIRALRARWRARRPRSQWAGETPAVPVRDARGLLGECSVANTLVLRLHPVSGNQMRALDASVAMRIVPGNPR